MQLPDGLLSALRSAMYDKDNFPRMNSELVSIQLNVKTLSQLVNYLEYQTRGPIDIATVNSERVLHNGVTTESPEESLYLR